MNITHFIVNGDDLIGTIYKSDEFGIVIVFRTSNIELEKRFEIYKIDGGEPEKHDLMNLVMSVLPK